MLASLFVCIAPLLTACGLGQVKGPTQQDCGPRAALERALQTQRGLAKVQAVSVTQEMGSIYQIDMPGIAHAGYIYVSADCQYAHPIIGYAQHARYLGVSDGKLVFVSSAFGVNAERKVPEFKIAVYASSGREIDYLVRYPISVPATMFESLYVADSRPLSVVINDPAGHIVMRRVGHIPVDVSGYLRVDKYIIDAAGLSGDAHSATRHKYYFQVPTDGKVTVVGNETHLEITISP